MAAVKPMMQQPGRAKPNSSCNNNNTERPAAPSVHQELTVTQVSWCLILVYPAQPAGSPRPSWFSSHAPFRSIFTQIFSLFMFD